MRLALALLALSLSSCIHVRAQSTETGASTTHGISITGPGTGTAAVCQITTSSVPSGTVGAVYTPFQLMSANCPGPLTWTITVGALPTGLSMSSAGLITGTPTLAGTASFTVKVTGTPSTITDIFDTGLSIAAAPSGGSPNPPDSALLSWPTDVAHSPSPNTVVTVGDGSGSPCDQTGGVCSYPTSQLNVALGTVGCGQTLEIQNVPITLPGGTIRLQNACDASNWITVTRDFSDTNFPAEGIRVTPCYAGIPWSALPGVPYYDCLSPSRHMPLLIKGSNTTIQFGSDTASQAGASSYRFIGIQWGRATNYDLDFGILSLQNNVGCTAANTACMNHQPNHIIFDRNIIQGDAQRQTTRAIALGGQWISIQDSYLYDIKLSFAGGGGDSQIYFGGSGKFITNVGWWKMQNNFASVSTMGCIFCGAFVEPISPITTFDGIPHDVWQTTQWFWKNPLWNTQLGQSLNETINIEGTNYGPQGDQEFIVSPSAIQVQQGTTYQFHNTALNDSAGGLDRMTDAGTPPAGSVKVDTLACTFPSTTTVGVTPPGTTVVVASVANLAVNRSILITGAGAGSNNYIGTITNISGTTLTVSPATTVSVGTAVTGVSVFDPVCMPGGDSTHGLILKNSSHQVGSSPYQLQNIISWTYIACSAAGTPFIDCTGPTTAAAHTLTFTKVITDGRYSANWPLTTGTVILGNTRTLTSSATVTVTAGAPTNQISLSPSAPDLQIQPSYSDAFGNTRQFAYVFFATPNFASVSLTYKVDGIVNGNATVGQICLATAAPCSAPGANDASVVYLSGTATGTHTISVTSAAGTTTSQVINVSTSAPIIAYDLKAFTSKNAWEMKCVSKGLFNNSILENAWGSNGNGAGQPGNIALNQPINQASQTTDGSGVTVGYGPEFASDLLVDHIHGLHLGGGMVIAALSQSKGVHRIKYQHVLAEDTNCQRWGSGFQKCQFADALQYSGTAGTAVLGWTSAASPLANDINVDHVTLVGGTSTIPGITGWMSMANNNAQFQLGPFSFTNSIITAPGSTTFTNNNGDTPDCNTSSGAGANNTEARTFQGTGYSPAKPCNSSYNIGRNALVDSTASPSVFTSTIWQPTDADADLFRNYNSGNGGDYRVVAGGRYDAGGARNASDATALGADVATIYTNDQSVRLGVRTGFPLSISTSSLSACTHGVACSRTLTASGGTAPYTWTTPSLDYVPGGAIDVVNDYAAMPLPDRNNFHLSGTIVKYFKLDAGLLWWIKNTAGNPWDGEVVGSDYIKQWFTEGVTFGNASGFKMYQTPVSLWKRYHVPGADDVVYTPGPNNYSTTANCGADGSPLIDNLGVRGELTGPFTDVAWQSTYGGDIPDGTPYLLAQKWIKCTANNILNCTTEEDYWLVKGYGQVRWCPKTLSGGVYVTGSCTQETSKVAGGAPTPNFACGLPQPPTSTLPPGALLTSAPAMTLVDSTGVITGTPNTVGTYTFTVQVQDANGLIAQKTFTLTVN